MKKILVTTYVAMVSGHISMSSIVIEAEDSVEAQKILASLQKEENISTRVHYAAVLLN